MLTDQFLDEIIPIYDPSLRAVISKNAVIETVAPKTILSNMGEREMQVRFLISGVIWGYMYNSAGEEITICFVKDPGEVIYGSEYLGAEASEITLETITECEIFSMPMELLLELQTEYPEIAGLYLDIMIKRLQYHWATKKMLYLKTARERYEWFLQEYPGIIDKVNHRRVASFLNMTPVTLSRIRTGKE